MFKSLKEGRLFERIVDQIKDEIISGNLNVGDKLPTEIEMASAFGVSRSAVREALRTLELSGLVTIKRGNKGGCFIQGLASNRKLIDNVSDYWTLGNVTFTDLAEARIGVESLIIGIVGRKGTKKDFVSLRKLIDNAEQMHSEGKELERIDEQFNFHLLLAKITGNRVFFDMLTAIIELLKYILIKVKPSKEVTLKTIKDHRKIVEFLEAGQVEEAKAVSSRHILDISKRLEKKYAEQRGHSIHKVRNPLENKGHKIK